MNFIFNILFFSIRVFITTLNVARYLYKTNDDKTDFAPVLFVYL